MEYAFSAHEAEWITERFLESREAYVNMERYLRGHISKRQHDVFTTFLIESLQCDFTEKQAELRAEGLMEWAKP